MHFDPSRLERLALDAQRGDVRAFGDLYDALARRIWGYFFRRVRHKETAEDLTAETFRKALEHLDLLDLKKGNVTGWLFGIAHNTLVDHWRATRATSDISEFDHIAAGTNVEHDAEARERLLAVRERLDLLPSDIQQALLLRVWDDLPYREIARILGKTEVACRMAVSRGLSALRQGAAAALTLIVALRHIFTS